MLLRLPKTLLLLLFAGYYHGYNATVTLKLGESVTLREKMCGWNFDTALSWYRNNKDGPKQLFYNQVLLNNWYITDPVNYDVSFIPRTLSWYNLTIKSAREVDNTIFRFTHSRPYCTSETNVVIDKSYDHQEIRAIVGEPVTLKCNSRNSHISKTVEWFRVHHNWNQTLYKHEDGTGTVTFPEQYESSQSQSWHNLIIKDGAKSGLYFCAQTQPFFFMIMEVDLTVVLNAKIGERVTLTCHPNTNSSDQTLEWLKLHGENYEVLYRYENEIAEVKYPILHEVQPDELWHNLTIKRITSNDVGVYLCNQTEPFPYETEVEISVNGTVELTNMVVQYSSPLELTYITDLSAEMNVQWTYMHIDQSQIRTNHHIYYATPSGGGVLPGKIGNFEPSGLGYGVLTNSSNQNTVGKYKYFILDPPEVIQKEFWVIGTDGLQCQQENNFTVGKMNTHNCSAVVSFGDIIPVFSWTKDGKSVQGTLTLDPQYNGYGRRWIYMHTFAGEIDDSNAMFTCKLSFKYDGPPSSPGDTSDPDYTESCNITYPYPEYAVQNTTITPGSEDGPFTIRVSQNLTCSAIGSPKAEYKWYCEGYPMVAGKNYTVHKLMVGPDILTCTCLAENTLSNEVTYSHNTSVEFFAVHASGIKETPKDVVVRFGESAKLECTAADFGNDTNAWRVQWAAEFDRKEDTTSIIYYSAKDSSGVISPFQNDFDEGELKYDLIMKYALANLAGTYFCMELNNIETDYWQAEVVVTSVVKCLGPKTMVKKGESTTLSCQLEYAGHLRPMMQWFHGDVFMEDVKDSDMQKEETVLRDHSSQISVDADPHYRCKVSFWSRNIEIHQDECSIHLNIGEN